MTRVYPGPLVGLAGQLGLLLVLAGTVGLGVAGWVCGLACGAGVTVALSGGMNRAGVPRAGTGRPGDADRAVLVGGVAALVGDAFARPPVVGTLVALTIVALVLDGGDGRVARRTGTTSALGARFDMEVDALLVLVLSLHVARDLGPWVLAIGRRATCSSRPAGCCPGSGRRCRLVRGARSSPWSRLWR